MSLKTKIINFGVELVQVIGIYVIWILLHYISAHLYAHFCTPISVIGFILSPFMVTSPHCIALRWVIVNGSETIQNMWISLGIWIITKLVGSKYGNINEN
jgi:hypothetical protein